MAGVDRLIDGPRLELLRWVRAECRRLGVRLHVGRGRTLRLSGGRVSGYFCGSTRVLAVCHPVRGDAHLSRSPGGWAGILAHEASHMAQWAEGHPTWRAADVHSDRFDAWLSGEDMPAAEVRRHAMGVLALELDCERRAASLLDRFGLFPTRGHRARYVRGANAYLFLHHRMVETRRWPTPERSPYRDPAVVRACPPRFLPSYDEPPAGLMAVYKRRGI